MQLSDKQILAELYDNENPECFMISCDESHPFDFEEQVQPASIDLRLGNRFNRFKVGIKEFDIKNIMTANSLYSEEIVTDSNGIRIEAGEIVFGEIFEEIYIPNYLSARIRGRNRLARLGISVHCTGDYVNPGYVGHMPLQIINHNPFPVILHPYIGICQMVLYELTDSPLVKYNERPEPTWNAKNRNPLAQQRINRMHQERKKEILKMKQTTENQHTENITKGTGAPIVNIYNGHVGDTINSAQNAGIQAEEVSGSTARLLVQEMIKDEPEIDFEKLLEELNSIKTELRKPDYDDDEHGEVLGDVSSASKMLKTNNKGAALGFLKKAGKCLYDVASKVGCAVVVEYLKNQLNL